MNKKSIIFFSLITLVVLSGAAYQYFNAFEADFAKAYTSGKPANGHLWAEMECSQGLCVTSGNNVGIGTDSPAQKLEVNGNILASGTGDVCNGAGKCLSSVFQTNVIVGTNPTCPTGQTAIAKMNGTTWYSSAQSSWSQIMCGQAISADGSIFLVNSSHTGLSCTNAGGVVFGDGSGNNMCKFSLSTCPSGWTQYNNWSATNVYCGGCSSSGHSFSNNSALESPPYTYCRRIPSNVTACSESGWTYDNSCSSGCGCGYAATCVAAVRTQVGCY